MLILGPESAAAGIGRWPRRKASMIERATRGKLVSGGAAGEATECVSLKVGRERTTVRRFRMMNRARPAQLIAVLLRRNEVKQVEHRPQRHSRADDTIVHACHELARIREEEPVGLTLDAEPSHPSKADGKPLGIGKRMIFASELKVYEAASANQSWPSASWILRARRGLIQSDTDGSAGNVKRTHGMKYQSRSSLTSSFDQGIQSAGCPA